jgi:23S rRNA pseudouridine2605 synthase
MYLLKYLAQCGICSRRKAAELIKHGAVKVNGKIVTMPFVQVESSDEVIYKGESVTQPEHVYILLNKPKDYLTTCFDERGRRTVMDLVGRETNESRIYPVGRLDRMTTGILLLTNDGALAQKLSHPRHNVPKQYRVLLNKSIGLRDCEKLLNGINLDDGFMKVDKCIKKSKRDVIVEIHSGRNRIVRRMFEELGYEVAKLDRILYAGLTASALPRGNWRFLTQQEIAHLLNF